MQEATSCANLEKRRTQGKRARLVAAKEEQQQQQEQQQEEQERRRGGRLVEARGESRSLDNDNEDHEFDCMRTAGRLP